MNTAASAHLEVALNEGDKRGRKNELGRGLYMGLSRQLAWRASSVALESLARQGGAHGTPHQHRSNRNATVARLVAPARMWRDRVVQSRQARWRDQKGQI